ncbi:hypothetical protein NE848_12050 [Gramella jeungdoensis]|uniref:STAS/SEC14 domain-containing protein n=1 Tax=Gramella jeungdoensis TaxID=708091 RepID=A0ABT0Z3Y6_9FLAO|nr:hypothetical protein [Gramella jeungdoensis]MCM8570115.1 hypothetical protein [Gramella jeungdoensis]
MPYKTTWEPLGIIWKFYGDVTAEEIEEANIEFYKDERSDEARYQVIDALEVTDVEWNDVDIKEIAAQDKGASFLLHKLKVAYVSKDEKVTAVLKKYIEISRILNSSWKFKGFDELAPALKWAKKIKSKGKNKLS